MKATNPRSRQLLEQAQLLGFVADDQLDGSGHIVLRHPNGVTRIASSPSDHRGDKNAIANMERIAGRKLPRPKSGRHRKGVRMAGYTQTVRTPSAESWSRRIDELNTEHHDLMLELIVLSTGESTHGQRNEALKCLRRLIEIEEILVELNQPLPEQNTHTLNPT